MDLFWQQVIIGASIALAVLYLVRHFFVRAFRKKKPCDSCGVMKAVEQQGKVRRKRR